MKLLDTSIFDLIIWPLSRINRVKNSWAGGSSRHAYVYDHILTSPFLVLLAVAFRVPFDFIYILLAALFIWHVVGKEFFDIQQGKNATYNWPNFIERLYGWVLGVGIFLVSRI